MSETEVQPLTAGIFRGGKVMVPLFLTHGVPDLITACIPPLIVKFDQNDEDNVPCDERQQDFVSVAIKRGVACLIDLYTQGVSRP